MAAVLLSTLLAVFTVAQLLLGGQAAYLQHPEPEPDMSFPQAHYRSFDTMQDFTQEAQAEYQPFDDTDSQKPNYQNYPLDNTGQTELQQQFQGAMDEEDTATTEAQTCSEEFTSQLKKLMESKKTCKSAGFHDCCQIKNLIPLSANGTYNFKRFCNAPCEPFSSAGTEFTLKGRCDMDTDKGGWLVIQRRIPKGTVNFTRSWEEYETGFGDINGEFWYGLRNMHCLTNREDMELRVDMVTKAGNIHRSTTYQTFKVGGAGEKYKLTVGGGKGFYISGLQYHNDRYFSTYDQDNDKWPKSCAYASQGGWWYGACYHSNLNGPHIKPSLPNTPYASIAWNGEYGSVEMKIRPKICHL